MSEGPDAIRDAYPPAGRFRRWLADHLVLPAVLYCLLLLCLYRLMTGADAWVVDVDCLEGAFTFSPEGRLVPADENAGLGILGGRREAFRPGTAAFVGGHNTYPPRPSRSVRGPLPRISFVSPDKRRSVRRDGLVLTCGPWGGTAQVRDAETGGFVRGLFIQADAGPFTVGFSPDGRRIAAALTSGTTKLWRVDDPPRPGGLRAEPLWLPGRLPGSYGSVFSRDGSMVVTAEDDTLYVWDARTGDCLAELLHGRNIVSAAFSPDGRTIAVALRDSWLVLWDARSFKYLTAVEADSFLRSLTFSADCERLLASAEHWTRARSRIGRWVSSTRVWRKRRPERWWGVFWLGELWTAAAAFAGFAFFLALDIRFVRRERGACLPAEVTEGPTRHFALSPR